MDHGYWLWPIVYSTHRVPWHPRCRRSHDRPIRDWNHQLLLHGRRPNPWLVHLRCIGYPRILRRSHFRRFPDFITGLAIHLLAHCHHHRFPRHSGIDCSPHRLRGAIQDSAQDGLHGCRSFDRWPDSPPICPFRWWCLWLGPAIYYCPAYRGCRIAGRVRRAGEIREQPAHAVVALEDSELRRSLDRGIQ